MYKPLESLESSYERLTVSMFSLFKLIFLSLSLYKRNFLSLKLNEFFIKFVAYSKISMYRCFFIFP